MNWSALLTAMLRHFAFDLDPDDPSLRPGDPCPDPECRGRLAIDDDDNLVCTCCGRVKRGEA